MPFQKRCLILGVTLAVMAFVGSWLAALQSHQGRHSLSSLKDGVGSAPEAFDQASRVIEAYLPTMEDDPCRIDPEYRATLSSRSKIWSIRGYAFSLNHERRSFRWTVILTYHEMQEWEILAQIITPETRETNNNQRDAISQGKGALIDGTGDR
jgi:hypothetical protein